MSEDKDSKPVTIVEKVAPAGGAQVWREVLGLIVGLGVAFAMVGVVLALVFPGPSAPEGLDYLDPVVLSAWFGSMPMTGVFVVALMFPAASFQGAVVMSFISRRRIWPRLVLGTVVAGAGYAVISLLPGDTGYAGATMLVCIPLAWIGVRWYFTGIWKGWNWRW